MILLPATHIAAAVAAQLSQVIDIGSERTPKQLTAIGKFLYGSGGTNVNAWLQTSLDGGTTWFDVINFLFTTAALTKASTVVPVSANAITLTDGALAGNTSIAGLFGRLWRVKYTTTGTYAGLTSLEVDVFGNN